MLERFNAVVYRKCLTCSRVDPQWTLPHVKVSQPEFFWSVSVFLESPSYAGTLINVQWPRFHFEGSKRARSPSFTPAGWKGHACVDANSLWEAHQTNKQISKRQMTFLHHPKDQQIGSPNLFISSLGNKDSCPDEWLLQSVKERSFQSANSPY